MTRVSRPLTAAELATLEYLLSAEFPNAEQLRQQVAGLLVGGECDCGCATIDLIPDKARTPPPTASANQEWPIVAAADSQPNARAHPAALQLHVDADGWLRELEIVDDAGINPQASFPPLDTWEPPLPADEYFQRHRASPGGSNLTLA
jgi:hypothetical protein